MARYCWVEDCRHWVNPLVENCHGRSQPDHYLLAHQPDKREYSPVTLSTYPSPLTCHGFSFFSEPVFCIRSRRQRSWCMAPLSWQHRIEPAVISSASDFFGSVGDRELQLHASHVPYAHGMSVTAEAYRLVPTEVPRSDTPRKECQAEDIPHTPSTHVA